MLMNHALSAYKEDAPRRIAIVDNAGQIPLLDFPGTAAFCTVAPGGEVQYYRNKELQILNGPTHFIIPPCADRG